MKGTVCDILHNPIVMRNICCFLFILLPFYTFAQANQDCSSVQCPEQLLCQFPKTPIRLPDPRNPKCCTKIVCTCKGTSSGTSSSTDHNRQYDDLVRRYTNCTLVHGNLEIVGIDGIVANITGNAITATKHIEQVTGYVLISRMYVHHIDLSSLYLIRGAEKHLPDVTKIDCGKEEINSNRNVTDLKHYSLFVQTNSKDSKSGLQELWLPNLTEITEGDVKFDNNHNLCYVDTILWEDEIFESPTQQASINPSKSNTSDCSSGSKCPRGCIVNGMTRCWGNSTSLCQKITKSKCTSCSRGIRCNKQGTCCSGSCAGGCLDDITNLEGKDSCKACKRMNNKGTCVDSCPWEIKLNPDSDQFVQTKNTYQFARYCVSQCPPNTPQTRQYCRTYCRHGSFDYENNICTECKDGVCENICYGLGVADGPLKDDTYINAFNIENFNSNCTIIEGSLYFQKRSFLGDSYCDIPELQNETIFDRFKNVREITGYLAFDDWPFDTLCVFKNLRKIRGKELIFQQFSLAVYTGGNKLKKLCFNSLQSIENGAVIISNNPYLCYPSTVDWNRLTNTSLSNQIYNVRDLNQCGNALILRNKQLCHVRKLNWKRIFLNPKWQESVTKKNKRNCRKAPCNAECKKSEGCWGDGATQCVECAHFTDYTNQDGKVTPEWVVDPNDPSLKYPGNNVTTCVAACNYAKGVYATSERTCLPCHKECQKTCSGPSPFNCTRCKHFEFNGECVTECPKSYYSVAGNSTCLPCSLNCVDGGCEGPLDIYGKDGCSSCHSVVDLETNLHTYTGPLCSKCSEQVSEKCSFGCTSLNNTSGWTCYFPPKADPTVFIIVGIGVLFFVVVILVWVFRRHRTTIRRMRKTIKDNMVGEHAQPENEAMPLTPSGAAPNQAQLRIVKEDELAMGKLLGAGAFGAVHKAIWTPIHIQGEKVKIAVAVKTLKTPSDISHAANNEIMDEAYMMASVDCVYLVRLLGISMTEHVSLITQLMPLGSLLEYVRETKNQDTMHARQMLTWFVQIAKGMRYLEEKHLVHRDLAARNVLVKTPNHVKITDFGLAKMLDVKEDTYQAEGGKLPIKWLAIECINERKFSHYSDVWAYGVTCWELLTLGGRPYEGVRAIEVLSLLERGERLPQPSSATIDVYMLLIKCWMVDRQSRPSFSELITEFSRMTSDPARYVVMKHDPGHCLLSPSPVDEASFFRQLMEDEKIDDVDIAYEPDEYLLCNGANQQEKYTPMTSQTTSPATYSPRPLPLYTNQSTVDRAQGRFEVDHARLFSRSTPSANPEPLVSISNSGGARESAGGRGNSNSDQDDVFADAGNSAKSMGANAELGEPSSNRKDSEETQRYTEDPTHKKRRYKAQGLASKKLSEDVLEHSTPGQLYDEEDYLLPIPNKDVPEGTDPSHPSHLVSLANDTYVESPPIEGPSTSDYGHLSSSNGRREDHEYVNTGEDSFSPTWIVNEEYMATDSGIGEDSQSLLSRGNTGNRGIRKESNQSSNGDDERVLLNNTNAHFRANQVTNGSRAGPRDNLWSTSTGESSPSVSPGTAVDNPEYMLLNASTSNHTPNKATVNRTKSKDVI